MNSVITHIRQNLTKNFALLFVPLLVLSCQGDAGNAEYTLELPSGEEIQLELALTANEQKRGLSGREKSSLAKNEGMLFAYPSSDIRQFWMPDTHFDLTIAFLDRNFKILALERNVPKHPGKSGAIPQTAKHWCRHVLEMRNDSPLAKKLKKGMQLKWKGSSRPWEKESKTHPDQ